MPSHRTLLAAARAQVATLADAERRFLAANPLRLEHEHDTRGARYVVRARVVTPPPAELADLAADAVRALRAALDAAASSLAGAATTFPIHESLPLFAQRARKAIARMPDEAQAAIEALQPYHAIGGYRNGPLWTLDELARADSITLARGALRAGGAMGVNTRRTVELLAQPTVHAGPFANGDVVASVPTRIVGPDPKLDMFLRVEPVLAFAADGPGGGREVVALLGELCEHVERVVLAALEPMIAARG